MPMNRLTTQITKLSSSVCAGPGVLPTLDISGHLSRLERRVSERLAEAGDFVRHIPRTVSVDEVHSSELAGDRSRLQERLEDHGLVERVVSGDGNCQVFASYNLLSISKGRGQSATHLCQEWSTMQVSQPHATPLFAGITAVLQGPIGVKSAQATDASAHSS